jgi:hypothetical protein
MQDSYPPASSRNNGNAIASLVIGIFSWFIFLITVCLNSVIIPLFSLATLGVGLIFYICTFGMACISPIGWLIGTILGNTAKKQIQQTGESGAGMAKAGFIMNLIGLVITALSICGIIVYIALVGTAGITQYFSNYSY